MESNWKAVAMGIDEATQEAKSVAHSFLEWFGELAVFVGQLMFVLRARVSPVDFLLHHATN